MIFLTAVFPFGESRSARPAFVAFSFIWVALVIYSASILRSARG